MKKSRIIKRAVLLAVLIFAVSALASYTITYITDYREDPLEGTWVVQDNSFYHAMVFKGGKTYTVVETTSYSPMEYQILSAEPKGDGLHVYALLSDDDNSYQQAYEIQNGDTMLYGDMVLKKQ